VSLVQKLRASVGLGATDGEPWERDICCQQMVQAAQEIERLQDCLENQEQYSEDLRERLLILWEFATAPHNQLGEPEPLPEARDVREKIQSLVLDLFDDGNT